MGLSDVVIQRKEVTIPGQKATFHVRGLSTADISYVFAEHGAELGILFGKGMQMWKAEELTGLDDMQVLLGSSLEVAPQVVSVLIALAADEPNEVDTIHKLPATVQIDAMEKIMALTLTSEAEVKKLLESVIRMSTGLTGTVNSLQKTPSDNGTGTIGNA